MKTLIITLEYPPQIGGISSYIQNMADILPYENLVIYAPQMEGDKIFDATKKFKTIRSNPYFKIFWPHWLKLFFRIFFIIQKEKISILHIHHILPVGYVAWIIKKFFKIPYIIFFHGSDIEFSTKTARKKMWTSKICRDANKIIVNSKFSKNKLIASFPELADKCLVVYPCPSPRFKQAPPMAELDDLRAKLNLQNKKVILTVARLSEGKGHLLFLRALSQILKEIPDAMWLIVGDGEKRELLMNMAREKNLENHIIFLGNVPYEKLVNYYYLADVFALLTHKNKEDGSEEAFGLAFLEAALAGLSVVAGSCGGVEETVIHNQTGLMVDAYDEFMVKNTLVKLLKDADFSRELGANGKKRAETEFLFEKQLEKLESI